MGMDIVGGTLSGALANQKEGGKDTGNAYGGVINQLGGQGAIGNVLKQAMQGQQTYSGTGADEIQNGPMSGLYGKGGALDRSNSEEQKLAGQGFQLTPEDHEAYGQASGNVARMFGQADQGLSQSLSDRGLSNSGIAGAAFSGAQGNKNEQLAGLQHQIADSRIKMNQDRLNSTRNFMTQLGSGANTAMNDSQKRGMNVANQNNDVLKTKAGIASGLLGSYQNQQNTGLEQQQQTEHGSNLSNTVAGFQQGKNQADQKVGSVAKSASKK